MELIWRLNFSSTTAKEAIVCTVVDCHSCFFIFSLLVFGCLAFCKFWVFCFHSPLLFERAPRPRMQELVNQLPSSLIFSLSSSKHSITFNINQKIIQNYEVTLFCSQSWFLFRFFRLKFFMQDVMNNSYFFPKM